MGALERLFLSRRAQWLALPLALLFLVAGWQLDRMVLDYGLEELQAKSRQQLDLYVSHLQGQLRRYEFLPELLATDARMLEALKAQGDEAVIGRVNRFLEQVNYISGALDVYLMNPDGLTIAASNWRSDKTFVGRNFSFRPYFKLAMAGELGRFFALGTTSQQRGYYFASPVYEGGRRMGVVVVKINIATLEQAWSDPQSELVVTDPDGVIFVTTNPAWRYRSLEPLREDALERIRRNRRYPESDLSPLPVLGREDAGDTGLDILRLGDEGNRQMRPGGYLINERAMADAGWRVRVLQRVNPVQRQRWVAGIFVAVVYGVVFLLLAVIRQRTKRRREREHLEERNRQALQEALGQLETRVAQRTADLMAANTRLQQEIGQHRATQEELIQTAKLAALGQMSAGISHELNQPLAAIRTYADNGRALLEQGRGGEAEWNLQQISELTERMAQISSQLKVFARRTSGQRARVSLRGSLEGALKILRPRLKQLDMQIHIDLPEEELFALADMVQLEQVLVNLLGNALNAVEPRERRLVEVTGRQEGDRVRLSVRDNGPGIPEQNLERIFDPFFTTSDTGLGLGLSISHRIVERMQGDLEAENHPDGGALFCLWLEAAPRTG